MTDDNIITEGELFDMLERISATCNRYIVRIANPPEIEYSAIEYQETPLVNDLEIEEWELLTSNCGQHGWRKMK